MLRVQQQADRIGADEMTTPTMEVAHMARGKQVTIGGVRRTIPAIDVERYERMVDQVDALYSGPEHTHERAAAVEQVGLYLVDDVDAEAVGAAMREAREAYEAAQAATRVFVLMAVEDDASEAGLARGLGIDRLTVRKYRGKQDRAK
ncbi:HTH DNA binding protein [Mycobacterium phage Pixie]|uniref:Helix-turn-helix DNA binding domain protein n=2 Tax=Keshuvirus pixie TaxID=1034114 RepID=G1D547_9CAUD|nr:HTH DNA binding protein [Mycobacterium phage Pixie]AEK09850.1 hypothetical protein PBI_PIXIE_38 [Mycobacterium phage Pixie]AOT23778.1 hypothetical protein SEA_TBOND007_38 [Mycobacterium phage TBond007]